MKKTIIMMTCILSLAACGDTSETNDQNSKTITEEDQSKLKDVQDANVELEKLDGEIDSLLNTLEN